MGITGEYKATRDGKTYCYAGTWQTWNHSVDWGAKVHLDAAFVRELYGAIAGVQNNQDAVACVKRMIEDVIERHVAVR